MDENAQGYAEESIGDVLYAIEDARSWAFPHSERNAVTGALVSAYSQGYVDGLEGGVDADDDARYQLTNLQRDVRYFCEALQDRFAVDGQTDNLPDLGSTLTSRLLDLLETVNASRD